MRSTMFLNAVVMYQRASRPLRHAAVCLVIAVIGVLAGPTIYWLGDPFTYRMVDHGLVAYASDLNAANSAIPMVNPTGFTADSWYSIGNGLMAFRPLDHVTHLPLLAILCAIVVASSLLGVALNLTVGRYPSGREVDAGAQPGEPLLLFN